MMPSGRFLSLYEKDQRSSVLEYASMERNKKKNGESVREKVILFRICTIPFDKLFSILRYAVERAVGPFHYNLSYCSELVHMM